jgi:nucleoid DNA-binding protein
LRRADLFTSKIIEMTKLEFSRALARRTGWHPETFRAFVDAFFYLVKDTLQAGEDVVFQNIGKFTRHLEPAEDFHGVAEGTSKPERYVGKFYTHEKFDTYVNAPAPIDEDEESEWATPPVL